MTTTLQLGVGRTLQLDPEDAEIVGGLGAAASGAPVEELTAAAVSAPIGYPPLSSCLAPGDRVALAIAAGLPRLDGVVRGSIAALRSAGVGPDRIVIVAADAEDAEHLRRSLPDELADGVEVEHHNAADEDALCFAGATESGEPVLLNRRLVEADVAIPVSCAAAGAEQGVFGGLFPAFSDTATQRATNDKAATRGGDARFTTAADEAGWLLGATLVVQVAPELDGGVAAVLAGPPEAVADAGRQWSERLWRRRVPARAALAIATLSGDAREQTWANVGLALANAERVLAADGAVVVCTEIEQPLDEAVAGALSAGDRESAARLLGEAGSPDAATALRLIDALDRGPIYLMSRLDPEWVEEIGLAPVANERELSRLVRQRGRCVVLEGAQHVTVELIEDD